MPRAAPEWDVSRSLDAADDRDTERWPDVAATTVCGTDEATSS